MKVVVGISGGVDSAVSAYLLKKEGYEVVGLFMKNWDSNLNGDLEGITDDICPQELDYLDAKKTCDMLSIPLYRVDFIKEYWDHVFTYFLNELKKGRTPNPDVMCNKYIKFDSFTKEAKSLGAEYIATGHYARTKDGYLYKGIDNNKDQSYFLSKLSRNQLKNVLFPVGNLTKEEVRKIASDINIPVKDKKDSTGICFIGERNYQKFIQNYLKPNPGKIINVKTGEIVGEHNGLMNYTIGQRRNVGLSGDKDKHYVCGKDMKNNILYVAFGSDNEFLMSDECIITNMSYISEKRPNKANCKFRYRSEDIEVLIEYLDIDKIRVKYPSKFKAVTPGQIGTIYFDDEVIGAGIIDEIFKNNEKLFYLK